MTGPAVFLSRGIVTTASRKLSGPTRQYPNKLALDDVLRVAHENVRKESRNKVDSGGVLHPPQVKRSFERSIEGSKFRAESAHRYGSLRDRNWCAEGVLHEGFRGRLKNALPMFVPLRRSVGMSQLGGDMTHLV